MLQSHQHCTVAVELSGRSAACRTRDKGSPEAEVQQVLSRDVGPMLLLEGWPGQGTMLLPCQGHFLQAGLQGQPQELGRVVEVLHGNEGPCTHTPPCHDAMLADIALAHCWPVTWA